MSSMPESSIIESRPQEGMGSVIFRNTAFITLGGLTLKGLTFLFTVFVIRKLGDERFGQYSIVLGFVGLFSIFVELGMTQYVMREVARDRGSARFLFWNLVTLRALLAILGIIGISLAGVLFGYSAEIALGILLYTSTFLLSALLQPLIAVLTANERFDYVSFVRVIGRIAFMLLGGLFLFMGGGYIWLVVASLFQIPLEIALALLASRRSNLSLPPFEIHLSAWPDLIRSGLPFGLISLFLTIAFSIDTVMLSWYEPDFVVGWYNVAYGLVPSLLFFFGGFQTAIVPSLTRTYVDNAGEVKRWYRGSVKFIMMSSLPIAAGGMLVAFPLIRFLYTDEFLPSALALQILIWDVPFLMFASFCGNITTITGEERAAARIYGINSAANVILNLYAIPRYGLIGASIVTVVTDLIGALQFYFLLRRKLDLPNMASVLIRVLIATASMSVVVWLAGDRNLFLLIGLGALVYLVAVLILQLVDDEEWLVIRGVLRRMTSILRPGNLSNSN